MSTCLKIEGKDLRNWKGYIIQDEVITEDKITHYEDIDGYTNKNGF